MLWIGRKRRVISYTAYENLILASSPLAYYPLKESPGGTAVDLSGHGHSMLIGSSLAKGDGGVGLYSANGNQSFTPPDAIKPNIVWDNGDTWVHTQLVPPFTVEAWLYLTTDSVAFKSNYLLTMNATRMAVYVAGGDNKHLFVQANAAVDQAGIGTTLVAYNTWFHIMFTVTQSGSDMTVTVFKNGGAGVSAASSNVWADNGAYKGLCFFGGRLAGAGSPLQANTDKSGTGGLAQVAFYGTELTRADAQARVALGVS